MCYSKHTLKNGKELVIRRLTADDAERTLTKQPVWIFAKSDRAVDLNLINAVPQPILQSTAQSTAAAHNDRR